MGGDAPALELLLAAEEFEFDCDGSSRGGKAMRRRWKAAEEYDEDDDCDASVTVDVDFGWG